MLVLTRKLNEKIVIDGNIEVEILGITDGKVKLGISAPKDIEIHRGEVYQEIIESNKSSVNSEVDINLLKNILKK
ncbi:hypothetical protein EUAN_17330 [Andreesenia angusta]|uniref:Translational regulator CsrA n=1 Tax=Andreesenia angusta TaxID=39480 RepID=A0A1S1V8A1_9FIRM|nr:carbon storage regulator CsrA [Andreesenia angusta]OHW61969.1 hypothetical protein EUAN_17330 [Andreesenia angusta]